MYVETIKGTLAYSFIEARRIRNLKEVSFSFSLLSATANTALYSLRYQHPWKEMAFPERRILIMLVAIKVYSLPR